MRVQASASRAPLLEAVLRAVERFRALSPSRRAATVAAALAALTLLALLLRGSARSDEMAEAPVRRGPLRITVSLAGTLQPARADSYGAEVPGVEMKVLELAPEGARVEPGALLIRFDEAPFRRELEAADARLVQARSELEQSRQALNALLASQRAERAEAEQALRKAELELTTFQKGTGPLAVSQSLAAVERARREAEDAQVKLEGLAPFAEKGFVSREELRTARLRAEQAQADLDLARQQHQTLVDFTQPQLLTQRQADVETKRGALATALARGDAQAAQARAALSLAQARLDESQRVVSEAGRKIDACQVRSRASGLVVWREIFEKGGERRKVRVGDALFAGTPILDLPDLSEMLLEGRVRESDIHRVESGQSAAIRLDAFPDHAFPAEVVRLGTLSGGGERTEARTFPLVLRFLATDARLRPGMSGRATVRCGEVADAVQVPVDAVRWDGDQAWCLAKGLTGPVRKSLTLGKSNAFFVEVKQGLAEGDTVLIGR